MFIYCIENLINGKQYIGKTKESIEVRFLGHLKTRKKSYIHNAIEKYGAENFKIFVLDNRITTLKELNIAEKVYIAFYKTYNHNFGYNLTKGGEGGSCWLDKTSEQYIDFKNKMKVVNSNRTCESHKKISVSLLKTLNENREYYHKLYSENAKKNWANEKYKNEMSKRMMGEKNPFYGKTHSQETIDKIKASNFKQRGSKRSQETRKNISNGLKGIKPSDDTRKKISQTVSNQISIYNLDTLEHKKISKNETDNVSLPWVTSYEYVLRRNPLRIIKR